jgi:hypothetical protein
MNIKEDLEYFLPTMKVCNKFQEHIFEALDKSNIHKSLDRFNAQKDYGINNFVLFIVCEFMRSEEFKTIPNYAQEHIQFLTKRKLQ